MPIRKLPRLQMASGFQRYPKASVAAVLLTLLSACAALAAAPAPIAKAPPAPKAKAPASKDARAAEEQARIAQKRAKGLATLAARLKLGAGATVADIGAGGGQDTWVWAGIVGPNGAVFAEEVNEKHVTALKAEAEKRKLAQVRPVLGGNDNPGLPPDSVDLAWLRLVYHHLSQPREMLRAIGRSLKPGGYLVVMDRNRGTLRDWVPRQQRRDKHFWTAETTVVREAREEGFRFVTCAEDCCEMPEAFVLVFQRPKEPLPPGRDLDPFLPLSMDRAMAALLPPGEQFQHPVFIALGDARQLISPILKRSSGPGLEIVLEEWATQKDERPALPAGVSMPAVLPQDGDPHLDNRPIDAVFFLDSYHLLFHGPALLEKLRQRLTPDGRIFILDREGPPVSSRREASHRRRIDPATVKRELWAAGFFLRYEAPRPASDRFLMVFGKAGPGSVVMQPIGTVHSPYKEAPGTPIQGAFGDGVEAWVELQGRFVPGLKDLDGFSHAILIYHFHKSQREEVVGKPYLEAEEHGIFSIRSPHRPNHIGFSIVKIKKIEGNKLHFTEVDVLDGTPVLDIKPYVRQFDARENAKSGWIERHFPAGQQPSVPRAK